MKAVVASGPGGPEVLGLVERWSPQPDGTHVLVRIESASVNRADLEVRRGTVPGVRFPRIPGCECAGTVSEDPSGRLRPGQKVVAFFGGMGRTYDGAYARFCAIRGDRVFAVRTDLEWTALAAVPVAYLTATGVLTDRLGLSAEHTLLVRGGGSAVGLAAIAIGHDAGATVIATTRSPDKVDRIRAVGADEVLIDDGAISERVTGIVPGGVDRAIDLVGPAVLKDSLGACAQNGALCAAGTLGGLGGRRVRWALRALLERVSLTDYDVETASYEATHERLQSLADSVAAGRLPANIESVCGLDEVASVHKRMEENRNCGKLVLEMVNR
ncbi:MAG: zinc-binding dehydrogenase [Candidatus Binatia bacterium]